LTVDAEATETFLPRLEALSERMVEALCVLVEAESPSGDPAALENCAEVLSHLAGSFLGRPPLRADIGGLPCLHWEPSREPLVALIGHFDTVHPLGSTAENPFRVEDGWAYGPGSFDMKAGIIQALAALSVVGLDGVALLLTPDEELGSRASRPVIEAVAHRVKAVLVPEPSFEGALKTARKGGATFLIEARGKAAHAGLEPRDGINATLLLAHAAIAAADLSDDARDTTVTPTAASSGGQATNIVPGSARLHVDVRAWTAAELERVDAGLRALGPVPPGARLDVALLMQRVGMEKEQSLPLFELARRVARREGLGELASAAVGGGSDGCLTAAVGTPTLDGLGPVGEGAHTSAERVRVDEMPRRAALVAGMIQELRRLHADDPALAVLRGAPA